MSEIKPITNEQLAELDEALPAGIIVHRVSLDYEDYAGIRARLRLAEKVVEDSINFLGFGQVCDCAWHGGEVCAWCELAGQLNGSVNAYRAATGKGGGV